MSSLHSASCLARSGLRQVSANCLGEPDGELRLSTSSMVMADECSRTRSGYSGVMPVRTALRPGVLSPTLPVPKSIPRPEYVGKDDRARGQRAVGADARGDREDARRGPDRGGRAGRGRQGRRARCDDRRTRPHRPRVHGRPRRLPVDAGLQGLPEVLLHVAERDHLPRHPGLDGDPGRRHRQHRRHRLHRRRARRHQRHLPGRRRVRGAPAARRAHPRGDDARDQGRQARPRAVDRRPRHRVVREPVRLQRGSRLHRPRHRHHLPQRAGGAALRPARGRAPSSSPG